MGIGTTGQHQLAHVVFLDNGVLRIQLPHTLLAQTDVEHAEVAYKLLILREEERQLDLLEGQCMVCTDDVGTHVVRIVLRHQSGRNVDGNHLGRRRVDILDQRGKTTCQRFVEAGTEESVDDQHIGFEGGRIEFLDDLDELMDALVLLKALLVGCTVGRKTATDVKEVDADLIVLVCHQPCHGQRVATIVSWSGKDDSRCRDGIHFRDGLCQCLGGTLHQIETGNRLVFDGVTV